MKPGNDCRAWANGPFSLRFTKASWKPGLWKAEMLRSTTNAAESRKKTATNLGLTVSSSLLAQANEAIE
jgi:hypothetical protein